MKIIVVANQKGGIGKSTTALTIASLLPGNVLFIDSDVQGNSTDTYHAQFEGVATLYDVMFEKDLDLNEAIQHTDVGDIIASDPLLREAEDKLRSMTGSEFVLADKLEELKNFDYDYVVIDTAPAMNQLLVTVLYAADQLIIPVTADRYAMQGLSQLFDTIELLQKRYHKDIKVEGFVIVRDNPRTLLSREGREKIENIAQKQNTKVFKRAVRECNKIKEAQTSRKIITKYDPYCNASMDYKAVVKELIGGESNGKE